MAKGQKQKSGRPLRTEFDEGSPYRRTIVPVTEAEVEDRLAHPKPKKGSAGASVEKNALVSRDEVREILRNNLFWYRLPAPRTDEEIAERLDLFFQRISETGEIPIVEKMALALGTTPQSLCRWEEDVKHRPIRAEMVKNAKNMMRMFESELAISGKIPPVTYIFRGKNYFDMKDQQDVVVSAKNPLDENAQSAEELAEKYKNSIAIEGQVEGKLS